VCRDGPRATSGLLDGPVGLAVDDDDNIYIADHDSSLLRRVSSSGALTTLTDTGSFARVDDAGDPVAQLADISGVAATPDGTLFVSIPGSGAVLRSDGDAPAPYATGLGRPEGLALDRSGNLYVADSGTDQVLRVDVATRAVAVVAGNGSECSDPAPPSGPACGDDGPAADAQLTNPLAVAVTPDGDTVYVADTDDNRIRRITGGVITTVAGTGEDYGCGCGGGADPTDNVAGTSGRRASAPSTTTAWSRRWPARASAASSRCRACRARRSGP
jgi:DNA-binding beta-propeller fold protein YncE